MAADTPEEIIADLLYVLGVARDRAVSHGNRLIGCGQVDMNRGQFLSLVDGAAERGRAYLKKEGAWPHDEQ